MQFNQDMQFSEFLVNLLYCDIDCIICGQDYNETKLLIIII